MTTTERLRVTASRVREAEEAVARLRDGFAGVGITLPSLRVDPVSCAGSGPAVLVDLGRCNLDTVRRLSRLLDGKAAGHGG
ncbi:hypothetical protein P8A22_17340 [Streptomyces laculatispora]|uniref:Secreted protein n=1 Tax=Streptomyces laculatispora TaxID=887464 RepID=A0ABY9I650_9ACTN|nr:hypothetical protein [Streptomyces laculatispora]WLQ41593.1 hypothetical protein P8A22_17340 [Streptomyces laculatispora]